MAKKAIPAGIGAVGKTKMKNLHPSQPLKAKYGTAFERDYLEGLEIQRSDRGRVSRAGKVIDRFHVTHPDFPEQEFLVAKRLFSVVVAPAQPFEPPPPPAALPTNVHQQAARESSVDSVGFTPPAGHRLSRDEIDELRAAGHTVDDDNEPDEENRNEPPPPSTGEWITPSFCRRTSQGHVKVKGRWAHTPWPIVKDMDELQLFLLCLPVDYIKTVILPSTNVHLDKELTMQEFFVFLGCLFFMACHPGVASRDLWWSAKDISPAEGAPFRLNAYFSKNRFKAIMGALRYTNNQQPSYSDKFHDVRQLIDAWNDFMAEEYVAGWWNCLDESMSVFNNPYCPGWMVVPRKPHPFGNEYHSICDGNIDDDLNNCGNPIMWRIELQEGKDRPDGAGPKKYSELGKTPGLMCRMHEPLRRQGKASTMDSGFCVSKGIVELEAKLGVYGQALIKKRGRYWPKGVPGDAINEHFATKEIGASETWKTEYEGKTMMIHCMKEEKYVAKFMATFGTLDEVAAHKTFRRTAAGDFHFSYPEPFSWHSKAKHWVDDHNQRRHSPIDLAEIWKTQWWPHRQFTFVLGIAEVNAANSRGRARDEKAEPVLQFRKKLALLLLDNKIDENGRIVAVVHPLLRRRMTPTSDHTLLVRPSFTGRWTGVKWSKTQQKHQKSTCCGGNNCRKRMRTYCACNKGVPLCSSCHTLHVMTVLESD